MKKLLILAGLCIVFAPHAFGQWVPVSNIVTWPNGLSTITTTTSDLVQFQNTSGVFSTPFPTYAIVLGHAADFDFSISDPGNGLNKCPDGQPDILVLTCYLRFGGPSIIPTQVVIGGLGITVYSPSPLTTFGKFVLAGQTFASRSAFGHPCFNAPLPAWCYTAYLDINQQQFNPTDSLLIPPLNPLAPGGAYYLIIDNSNCSDGHPSASGTIDGTGVVLFIGENNPGGTNGYSGTYLTSQPTTGFNRDGSQAPFSGATNEIQGTNNLSSGCPTIDSGTTFTAWQYPDLGTADLTLSVTSQPGTLNLHVDVSVNLQENADFSVSATGTITGPVCGPLSFSSVDGLALGNLYGIDFNYTTPTGATGTGSLGLSIVAPFTVSQSELQSAGYIATGPGIPLQIWTYDISASSDGACPADPGVGLGVAYPRHEKHPRRREHEKRDRKFDWEKFRNRYEHARATDRP